MSSRRRVSLAALLVLIGLPLFLRLASIDHGAPRNYLPDTHVVRNALGMLRDKDPVPPVSKYSSYPNLIPYMLIPVYGTQFVVGKVTGQWEDTDGFKAHVMQYPHTVHVSARVLVAVLGSLAPLFVFLAMRAAGQRSGAWIAAWLCATSLLGVHFSTQERPWGAMLFFQAAALWPAVLYVRDGRTKHLLWCGVCAGLAFACHQAGVGTLALCGFAWFFGGGDWKTGNLGKRLALGVGCVAVFALVALLLGHPYYLRYGATPAEALSGKEIVDKGGEVGISLGGQAQPMGIELRSLQTMSLALMGHDLVLFILFLPGLWRAFRVRELRAALCFAVIWAAVFMTNKNDFVRYLMPVCALFAIPAGVLLQDLWDSKRTRWSVFAALAFPLVMSLRLVFVLAQPDTREEAELRLRELPQGALVAVDRYGPLPPPDFESLKLLKRLRETPIVTVTASGEEIARTDMLRQREDFRYMLYESGDGDLLEPGASVLRIEDVLEFWDEVTVKNFEGFDPDLSDDPIAALRSLGVTHVLAVDRSPGERHDKELPLSELLQGIEPTWVIDPSSGEKPAREAFLPADMTFPLTGLWEVRRPGPKMALYELR